MVRIEEKSLEEKTVDAKFDRLVTITREIIRDKVMELYTGRRPDFFSIWDLDTRVLPGTPVLELTSTPVIEMKVHTNRVHVKSPQYFGLARRLAEAYEKHFKKEEFTVKKDY